MSNFLVGWVELANPGCSSQIRVVYQITYGLLNPSTQLLI
jgi:hypothetical protein